MAPPVRLSRRSVVRGAAALAAASPLVSLGCAKRVPLPGTLRAASAVDGKLRIAQADAGPLQDAGGALIVTGNDEVNQTGDWSYLVVNTGTELHCVDAFCPHAACTLAYVADDREVECPCHGSRFATDGALLGGPAQVGLTKYPVTLTPALDLLIHIYPGNGVFPAVSAGKLIVDLANHPALEAIGGVQVGWPEGTRWVVALIRQDAATVIARDGLCPHLGCIVQPGTCQSGAACTAAPSALRAGDVFLGCPCHQSAFSLDGRRQAGPAPRGLGKWDVVFDSAAGTITVDLTKPPGDAPA